MVKGIGETATAKITGRKKSEKCCGAAACSAVCSACELRAAFFLVQIPQGLGDIYSSGSTAGTQIVP
jgi:hypothetical protein